MLVVLDTNVLVSALMSKNGAPADILRLVLADRLTPCIDARIMCEYTEVLQRPKFGFSKGEINSLLDWFKYYGESVNAEPCDISFTDESDKKFYEVAVHCGAVLITGNLKHYPKRKFIIGVSDFLKKIGV